MRFVDAGWRASAVAGRMGLATKPPPQLGQRPSSRSSTQRTQNVHSKEQIRASGDSGGSAMSQHSQEGLSSSMGVLAAWIEDGLCRIGGVSGALLAEAGTIIAFFPIHPSSRLSPMTTIVTGAAGFIGSNLVKALNERGVTDIIAVDDLTQADKFHNLVDCEIADYLDRGEFLERFAGAGFGKVDAVLHQGACSDTMETDGRYMMENNFRYSLAMVEACGAQRIPFLYASSAATYGAGPRFVEERGAEKPLNVYGYSKFLFDQIVRKRLPDAKHQIAGFRYFNVYGPRESHKGRMASVAFHNFNQFGADGRVKLFEGWAGYGDGMQQRDFVSVEDVVKVNLHFLDHGASGIYNLGTGRAQTFNDVAMAVVNSRRRHDGLPALTLDLLVAEGLIEYVAFPEALKGKYQSFTQADVTKLRGAGYTAPFLSVEDGVSRYADWLSVRAT